MLVTGASGFLGMALVQRLLAEKVGVRILVRSPAKAAALTELGAEAVVGDVTDRDAVRKAAHGVRVVYHLAGRLLVPGVPAREYERTHVDGTAVVLECAAEQAELARFVHCSTTGVLGVTGDDPADEMAQPRPTNVYEATKARGERLVRDASAAGLPVVIIRPGLVYGPGDLHLLGFFRAVLRRRFRPIGSRPVWLHPIYIDDMTEALLRSAAEADAVGETVHVAGREPVTLQALAATIALACGTALPPGTIPMAAARAVAVLGDLLPPPLQRSAPLTSSRLDFLTHSRVYDVTRAKRLLKFTAGTDLTTGIARTVEWYRRHGYLPAASAAYAGVAS